jgi:hypothetical protein
VPYFSAASVARYPPAGADLDQFVPTFELQLLTDQIEVVVLRLIERGRIFLPISFAVAVRITEHEMKEIHRQAVVKGRVAFCLRKVLVVLLPTEEASLQERQRMLDAPERLSVADVDRPA